MTKELRNIKKIQKQSWYIIYDYMNHQTRDKLRINIKINLFQFFFRIRNNIDGQIHDNIKRL